MKKRRRRGRKRSRRRRRRRRKTQNRSGRWFRRLSYVHTHEWVCGRHLYIEILFTLAFPAGHIAGLPIIIILLSKCAKPACAATVVTSLFKHVQYNKRIPLVSVLCADNYSRCSCMWLDKTAQEFCKPLRL